mmetsp:Transcript_12904/g.20558  ORF Transcript_12904/g.20558 Transcript_12904/m.20558 type:complete len:427 (+) Transcript_12904:35-1315(+)
MWSLTWIVIVGVCLTSMLVRLAQGLLAKERMLTPARMSSICGIIRSSSSDEAPVAPGAESWPKNLASIVRNSRLQPFDIRGREVWVKREDEFRLDSGISGNKARKLFWLNQLPKQEFPKVVVSHGGHQSNAMLAIAAVCAKFGSEFRYYVKKTPRWLRNNPSGNYARVLALGTRMLELDNADYNDYFGGPSGKLSPPQLLAEKEGEYWDDGEGIYIPQGGALPGASAGLALLADEIARDTEERGWAPGEVAVVVPAGTGTTALFLARHLVPRGFHVAAVPCVGDGSYLRRQMVALARETALQEEEEMEEDGVRKEGGEEGLQWQEAHKLHYPLPVVIEGTEKLNFGEPNADLLEIWRELEDAGLFVDLLYAPRAWQVMFENWDNMEHPVLGRKKILYVHSGGLEGVSTQLTRYKHKGLIDPKEAMG